VFLTPHIIKEASTPQVAQQREQTLPTSSDYTQEQTIVPDRKQSVSEALDQASVQLAMPK
jgi:hypothetical protein